MAYTITIQSNHEGENMNAENITQFKNFNIVVINFDSFSRPTEEGDMQKFAEMIAAMVSASQRKPAAEDITQVT